MKDYKEEYYEQSILWDCNFLEIPAEKERLEKIIKIIPSDVQTILDVGCGNGVFVNTLTDILPGRFDRIVGVDSSKEALKFVKVEKYGANISSLPFTNKSYDLLTSLEVLEHLSQEDFKKGILELQRVAKKYIIITVPNEEDLEHSLVICPECNCWFNPSFHVRSFDSSVLNNMFNNYKLINIKEIGPVIEYRLYPSLLYSFYRNWRKMLPPKTSICPQCGFQHREIFMDIDSPKVSNYFLLKSIFLFIKSLGKLFYPLKRKRRWLLALYEKKCR